MKLLLTLKLFFRDPGSKSLSDPDRCSSGLSDDSDTDQKPTVLQARNSHLSSVVAQTGSHDLINAYQPQQGFVRLPLSFSSSVISNDQSAYQTSGHLVDEVNNDPGINNYHHLWTFFLSFWKLLSFFLCKIFFNCVWKMFFLVVVINYTFWRKYFFVRCSPIKLSFVFLQKDFYIQ